LIDLATGRTTFGEMSLVTTKEAAQILGVTPVRVRQLIKEKRLAAEKHGRDHLLQDREVERFKRHGRRSGPKGGRPPGNGT
jgi:excisionase family DNA binding protein